jgi:hypothetical protein
MPALGFMAAGIAPGPPGNAIFATCGSIERIDEVRLLRYAAASNFCGVQSGGRKMPTIGKAWRKGPEAWRKNQTYVIDQRAVDVQ